MKKILHLNSFFTKIILAVLSFAVLVCIFIPYMNIPAVSATQNVDTANATMSLAVGVDKETVNIISDFGNGQPYVIYEDEELTEPVEKTSIPTPEKVNTYYLATYAYGYDVVNGSDKLDFVLIDVYTVKLNKDTKNNSPVITKYNMLTKQLDIRVPNATNFDFTRVIDTRKAWASYDSRLGGSIPGDERTETNKKHEVTSLTIDAGSSKTFYIAISVRSEKDPYKSENDETNGVVYSPLKLFTLTVTRDSVRRTLPTVGEAGMGLLSYLRNSGATYGGDAIMFALMIAAAVSTLGALIIPNKFKVVGMIISAILGAALIALPNLDYYLYFRAKYYLIEPGYYVLMVLGALILIMGVFDWYRCRSEYREEQIRIYGEDVFKKKK